MQQTKRGQRQLLVSGGRFSEASVPSVKNRPGSLPVIRNISTAQYAGTHIVADFWYGRTIESTQELKRLLRKAAEVANSKALKISIFKFSPQGITGVILLAESHIAVHTWPEIGYMAVDVFTCGAWSRPREALEFLKEELRPQRSEIREMKRGFYKSQNSAAS